MVTKVAEASQVDVVFDSNLENFIKESTRASLCNDAELTEYVNLLLESSPPVMLKRFWASSKRQIRAADIM